MQSIKHIVAHLLTTKKSKFLETTIKHEVRALSNARATKIDLMYPKTVTFVGEGEFVQLVGWFGSHMKHFPSY